MQYAMLTDAFRDLIGTGIRSALDGLPAPAAESPAAGLHPRIARMTSAMQNLGIEDLHNFPVMMNRLILDTLAPLLQTTPPEIHAVENRRIPGPEGLLPARIYRPVPDVDLPIVLFFHGGGWVLGSLDSHDPVCRLLARESGCLVVSVEYRKAPEAPFPAAIQDAHAAFAWVQAEGRALGGDPDRVALAGDSAGGNICAVLASETRTSSAKPALQILFYPAVDILPRTKSAELFAKGYFLTMEQIAWFRSHYLPSPDQYANARVSPLLADDFRGLPRTLLITAGFDPLRDDGKAYADKLQAAGTAVQYHCYENMPHGFLNMTLLASEGEAALKRAAAELRDVFSR